MKKFFSAILILFAMVSVLYAERNTDMVVLLDNSVSVLPIYEDIEEHLIRGIVETHLVTGDRFHLISFADSPEVEISKEIRGQEQVDDILAYVQILQPMGQYTDLLLALMFLDTYVEDLSLITDKKILILTDGVHDPPPDSPFYGLSEEMVSERVADFSRELRKKGWDFHILSLNGNTGRGEKHSYLDELTKNLGVVSTRYSGDEGNTLSNVALGVPRVIFPESLGEVDRKPVLPLVIKNFAGQTRLVTITGVIHAGRNILRKETALTLEKEEQGTMNLKLMLPEDMEPGEHMLDLTLITPEDVSISPQKGTVKIMLRADKGIQHSWKIILIIAAVVLGAGVVFLVARFFSSGFVGSHDGIEVAGISDSAYAAPKPAGVQSRKPTAASVPTLSASTKPLEMLVSGQSRFAGRLNVLNVPEGTPVAVGGRNSGGFVILIAHFPAEIGRIEKRGEGYSFVITEDRYFPRLSGVLYNCLDKDIPVSTDKGEEVIIRFRTWISPLERINRILHLTDRPGLPDFDY